MAFHEINRLRKNGALKAAYAQAEQDLQSDPDNIWSKRAMAWVYYAFLKQKAANQEVEQFIKCLNKLKELELPEDEQLVFDQTAWQVGKVVFAISKQDKLDTQSLDQIFNAVQTFYFSKPSDGYSFLFKAFHKAAKMGWRNYLAFADWWGFAYFQSNDFEKEKLNDGKLVPSVAERAYNLYAKELVNQSTDTSSLKAYEPKAKDFLPWLDNVLKTHPEFEHATYYKGKLLLKYWSDREQALQSFLPFAKENSTKFWVWNLLAEIFKDDDEARLACLCKIQLLNPPEALFVKVSTQITRFLLQQEEYDLAKTEVSVALDTAKRQSVKVPEQLAQWQKEDWYQEAQARSNNTSFYKSYTSKAENLLYHNEPEYFVVVEFVNKDKKVLNFIHDKAFTGFFKYKGKVKEPKIGDILKVKMKRIGNEGRYQLYTAEHVQDTSDQVPGIKSFKGPVTLKSEGRIGFVNDSEATVFLSEEIINSQKPEEGQEIKGKAILSYNKKKGQWGWKCIAIDE